MNFEIINSREFAKRVVNYKSDRSIHSELQKIHFELFNKNFRVNCGNCIRQAYVNIREKINNMVITNKQQKQMGQFELKKGKSGISKQIHIDHDVITNDNLTDEIAIDILRKHPSHIATFERYPENWKGLTSVKKVDQVKTEEPKAPLKKTITTESKKSPVKQ